MDKIFVTAEIGTSWQGDYEILDEICRECKTANIDAVKFQSLSPELIYRHTELDYYRKASLDKANIMIVNDICRSRHLEFYSSVTYPEAILFLNKYVTMLKIRTCDSNNLSLIRKCLDTGKTVIVSSFRPLGNEEVINLYCIPRYPTPFEEINFDMIRKFDGYSNHCANPLAILKAVSQKAKYIEFHITPSRSHFLIDNSVSLTLPQMQELMKWIRFENRNNSSS